MKQINYNPQNKNLPIKSSSTGLDSSPFMKVKEEFTWERKKRRRGRRRKRQREREVEKEVEKSN